MVVVVAILLLPVDWKKTAQNHTHSSLMSGLLQLLFELKLRGLGNATVVQGHSENNGCGFSPIDAH